MNLVTKCNNQDHQHQQCCQRKRLQRHQKTGTVACGRGSGLGLAREHGVSWWILIHQIHSEHCGAQAQQASISPPLQPDKYHGYIDLLTSFDSILHYITNFLSLSSFLSSLPCGLALRAWENAWSTSCIDFQSLRDQLRRMCLKSFISFHILHTICIYLCLFVSYPTKLLSLWRVCFGNARVPIACIVASLSEKPHTDAQPSQPAVATPVVSAVPALEASEFEGTRGD